MNRLDLLSALNENYLMLVPALWVLGFALKQTPKVPNWSIIWILTILSLGLAVFAYGFNVDAITNGLVAAGVAVYGHQLVKHSILSKNNNNKQ
ncbi:phage holin family protein [Bacillus marasmi]|uniref:phage holin family protein n=1 Tax=Bacillus marasmi TaxID=1926279 RepID=UPI00319E6854